MTQQEIYNLNRHIFSEETEWLILKLSTKKNSGPDGLSTKFYQTLKKEVIPMFHKLLLEKERILPTSFCETSIALLPKTKIKQ